MPNPPHEYNDEAYLQAYEKLTAAVEEYYDAGCTIDDLRADIATAEQNSSYAG